MGGVLSFNPANSISSLEGKVVCVTGGTLGLGREIILALAQHNPATIYFTGRNAKAALSLIADARHVAPSTELKFLQCDFAQLASIQASLHAFAHPTLDLLICNASVMDHPLGTSDDGFEIHFAINHLGNALVIRTLLPRLLKAAHRGSDVRVVALTCTAWHLHPAEGIQFATIRSPQDLGFLWRWRRYGQSKLANIVYTAELARRFEADGVRAVSVHPGVVSTGMAGNLSAAHKVLVYVGSCGDVVSTETGVRNPLWAAVGARKRELVNGAFYMPVGVNAQHRLSDVAKSMVLGKYLWEWTDSVLEEFLPKAEA